MAPLTRPFSRCSQVTSDLLDDDYFNLDLPTRPLQLPAANITEEDDKYHIELAVPGMDKNDLAISVNNGGLTISAEKEEEDQEEQDKYTRREFSYRTFQRSFTLPVNTDEDQISAQYNDGVLNMDIKKKNKTETSSQKKIDIS